MSTSAQKSERTDSRPVKRLAIFILPALILLCLAATVGSFFYSFTLHATNQKNRNALVKMHGVLTPGDPTAKILTTYNQYRTAELSIDARSATEQRIDMPLEFGAGNWRLVILCDPATGKITSVQMRTEDGPAPKDGPPDK